MACRPIPAVFVQDEFLERISAVNSSALGNGLKREIVFRLGEN